MIDIPKKCSETNATRNAAMHSSWDNTDDPSALTISDSGIITGCNKSCARLLGCKSTDLKLQHISKFFPQIRNETLFEEHHVNPRLCFLSRIGYHFQVVTSTGARFVSKMFFVELANTCENYIRVTIRPIDLVARNV